MDYQEHASIPGAMNRTIERFCPGTETMLRRRTNK
jgi:hypothetical protein